MAPTFEDSQGNALTERRAQALQYYSMNFSLPEDKDSDKITADANNQQYPVVQNEISQEPIKNKAQLPKERKQVVAIPKSQARQFQRAPNQTGQQAFLKLYGGSGRTAGRAPGPFKSKGPMTLGGTKQALTGAVQTINMKPSPPKTPVANPAPEMAGSQRHEDLDGTPTLCPACRLPMGDFGYYNDSGDLIHGECLAQIMHQDMVKEDKARQKEEADLQSRRRQEYDIGWKVECIPCNMDRAVQLGCELVPQGMCCLVVHEYSRTVDVVPTMEPAAAVNLEYLATALQVRRTDGREPMFSLDPVDPGNDALDRNSMQVKKFEPEWLAGTNVGEVLFQSDYHLKELSMGQYDQPVVGMKSCFEFSAEQKDEDTSWSAREWFMVRDAKINLSEDNVLVPTVHMGIEAREQELTEEGVMVDKPITRKTHPMVLYAEEFTRNFDLIAERKSVVYHLRELAKASVLAKFLIENHYSLHQEWFAGVEAAEDCCSLEIPQLWNERLYSQIQMKDGEIVTDDKGLNILKHGVYGGVELGLSKIPASAKAAPRRIASVLGMTRKPRMAGRPGVTGTRLSAGGPILSGRTPSSMVAGSMVQGATAINRALIPVPTGAVLSAVAPQGVDLNLDSFNLSTAERMTGDNAKDISFAIGDAFWSGIGKDSKDTFFEEEDRALLCDIFNPHLCDRRDEGDRFVPPDTRFSYVSKLRSLVKEETSVREKRKEHFFSKAFDIKDLGSLFPQSWKSTLEVKHRRSETALPPAPGSLHERWEDCYAQRADRIIKEVKPMFDKCTEDGMRFRIYRVGTIEVRTTQEYDAEEKVGVVYSIRQNPKGRPKSTIWSGERIVKVTEYVEQTKSDDEKLGCSYYLVMETDKGNVISTEKIASNIATWEENGADIDDRNSLAKVIRTGETKAGSTVQDIKNDREKAISPMVVWSDGAPAVREGRNNRLYAQDLFIRAMGGMEQVQRAWAARDKENRDAEAAAVAESQK